MTLSLVITAMFAFVALRQVLDRHGACISCGRRFEHAPNCPTVRSK